MKPVRLTTALLLAPLASACLSGCTVNPATGARTFTGGLSTDEEVRIGREQHPQIVKQFGGECGSPDFRRYVDSIGQLLARTVERRELQYTFTVLNSPIVNAFAISGGYVYVTRGLVELADNEAQLAGVMAHELGHVTALHHARRYGQGLLATVLLGGLAVAGGGSLAQVGQLGATALLQSYSRENEFEADDLAMRYMSRAGYDPRELAVFLAKLRANSRLTARLMGRSPDEIDQFDFMATHPAPVERVQRASSNAAATAVAQPMTGAEIYLDKLDGLLSGDDPEQGFVRGRVFVHPELGFAFEVPEGFRLFNSAQRVAAVGPGGAQILFDRAFKPAEGPMTAYLQQVWARRAPLDGVERLDINGLDAATGTTRARTNKGTMDLRLVAIRLGPAEIYRFMFATPPRLTGELSEALRRTTYSFRRLDPKEASRFKPLRVRVVRVRPGETVQSLAQRMAFADFKEERFRVLNGILDGRGVRPDQRVKIIAE